VEPDGDNLGLADYMISTYAANLGHKKDHLNQEIRGLEEWGYDYRLVRGLATLLDRRCRLETKAPLNPVEIRRSVFQSSSATGIPTTGHERSAILSSVGEEYGVEMAAIEESFYSDLQGEMVLAGFEATEPIRLLRQYNLSLTQTLLFNASELSFTTSGNWQHILRDIKWLGLIYLVRREGEDYWVKIDGPVSLFKLTRRYGTALAKLVPSIVNNGYWRLTAKVVGRGGTSLLDLELDSAQHGRYMKDADAVSERPTYDSTVEEDFAQHLDALDTGWKITREPGPLPVGDAVMIPDFLFEKAGLKVFMEIVGFWTPEYLREKMRKLSMARDVDMIVAINRRLACQVPSKRLDHLSTILYRDKVPLKPILAHLKQREEQNIGKEVENLQPMRLNLTAPVITSKQLAQYLKVSEGAVRNIMDRLSTPGYRRLGDVLVRETVLNSIKTTIDARLADGRLSFSEASRLIESTGASEPSVVLDALGFIIAWHGISPDSAEIRPRLTERAPPSPPQATQP
jgi:predicted nuclease of restriction endonuclease-like RecB superfamily